MSQAQLIMTIEEQAKAAAKAATTARKAFAAGKCGASVAEYWQGRADSLVKLVAMLAVTSVTNG